MPATRYDRSAIMRRAWAIFREIERMVSRGERRHAISFAMQRAWTEAKQTEADRQREAITRQLFIIDNQSGPYAKHREERRRLQSELAAIAA
jgi:hypothetical protein